MALTDRDVVPMRDGHFDELFLAIPPGRAYGDLAAAKEIFNQYLTT